MTRIVLDLDGFTGRPVNYPTWLRGLADADSAPCDPEDITVRSEFARWIADQIEAQLPPTRPAEPTGTGAVVKDVGSVIWVRTFMRAAAGAKAWRTAAHWDDEKHVAWDQIKVVKVLSEGYKA